MPSDSKNQAEGRKRRSRLARWLDFVWAYPLAFILLAFGLGIVSIPVTDEVDVYFSSNQFCATSCHEMESTVYKEFQQSAHWTTATGVRPTCGDCHVSERLIPAMWDHVLGTKELFVHFTTDVSEPGAFENFRAASAERVRQQMLDNDSKNCRTCHVMEAIQPERKRGQRQHAEARKQGTTCIACHYNLVHKEVEASEAFLKAIEGQ